MQGLKRGIVTTSDSLDVDGRDLELMTGEGAVVKEMEAAAVAWVCKQLGCPFVAIKAVTDIVDGEEATREEFESNLGQAARCASQPRSACDELLPVPAPLLCMMRQLARIGTRWAVCGCRHANDFEGGCV